MADRAEYTMHTTEVTHVAKPHGPVRENPPHLWDLRRFVEACEGLPHSLVVTITKGESRARDSGRHDVTFAVKQIVPVAHPEDDSEQYQSWLRRFTSAFGSDDEREGA